MHDNRRKLKEKYCNIYPNDKEKKQLGLTNIILLQNALFFAKNILHDINELCEGDEYIKKNFYVPRFDFSPQIKELIIDYSQLSLPITHIDESKI